MPDPLIIFVTGASATGKTAVYEYLKARSLDRVAVHDVDENGVPEDRGHYWGMFRIEQLLYQAKENAKEGMSTVICGIAFPHDVVDSRYYESDLNIHYVLLKCNKKTMRHRLKERLTEQGKKSGWKRLTESNQRVQKKMEKQTASKARHLIIDTAVYDTPYIADKIYELLGYKEMKNGTTCPRCLVTHYDWLGPEDVSYLKQDEMRCGRCHRNVKKSEVDAYKMIKSGNA